MSNLVINANSIYDRVIRIGRQTENLVSEITLNVKMWIEEYGAGECVLNVRRNGDANAYPVPMTITDGLATWTIKDTDVAKKGRGEIQLKYIAGEKVKTSPIFTISVGESLVGDGEPPSGYEDWLTELGEMTAQVEAAKTSASASAQTAQTAAESATQAQASVTDARAEVTRARAEADRAKTYADRAAEVELEIPTKVSELENDAGYLTEHQSLADYVRKDVLYNMLPVDTASGSIASFPDGADDIPLKSLVIGIEPVQDLHGYDSPWPAGGGKNLLNTSVNSYSSNGVSYTKNEDGTYTVDGTAYSTSSLVVGSIELVANTQYILSGCPSGGGGSTYNVRVRDSNYIALGFDAGTETIITPSETKTYYYQITVVSGASVSNLVFKPMIRLASISDSTYAPYSNICPISGWTGMTVNANGTEIPISWESEAGTIYGGTLDVTNGVLTVTKGYIQSYNGETLPSAWISDRDVYAEGATPTTGAEVCYDLATPITYQLTPTEVKSLLGQNNIWADTGDTNVVYRADTSAYIAKKIAEAISALS